MYSWLVISKIKERWVTVIPGYITVLVLKKYGLDSQLVEVDVVWLPIELCWFVPKAVLSFMSSSVDLKAIFSVRTNQCK